MPPKAAQLTRFEQLTQEYDEAVTPMIVELQDAGAPDPDEWKEYLAGGTHGGETILPGLDRGGWKEGSTIHFTISKQIDDPNNPGEKIDTFFTAPARHDLCRVGGQTYQIIKAWGQDGYIPTWSFRAERWQ
ncbi:MAG: hypothetical protein AAF191_11150 [Verrucomicrobiota bacterium]